jgi:Flp pilus assembly protein TadG
MTRVRTFAGETGGATAVEFALTAPMFMALVWGIIEVGLGLWTQYGLENGVEAAARCASVNTKTCTGSSTIATYAANNTMGVTIPSSAFTFSKVSCGNQVSASYDFAYLTNVFHAPKVTLAAQACFPDINAGG